MSTNGGASKPIAQAIPAPTEPFLGAAIPGVNYAIALQQYQFQQSLLAQQQLAANSVSIKVAAEQAAARAAEISKLLKATNSSDARERSEECAAKRETSVKSSSQSPSKSLSSRSKSASPTRCREDHGEHRRKYSPRDKSRHRYYRYSSYNACGFDDQRDYRRERYRSRSRSRRISPCVSWSMRNRCSRSPGHRRSPDHSRTREYSYHHSGRSGSRSRRRTPISCSMRYRHSRSPRRYRSPSPSPRRRMSEKEKQKSLCRSRSISSSPYHARTGLTERTLDRKSYSSPRNSKSPNASSPSMTDDKGNDYSSNEANKSKESEDQKNAYTPSREQSKNSGRSRSPLRSETTSVDHSAGRAKIRTDDKRTSDRSPHASDDCSCSPISREKVSAHGLSGSVGDRCGPIRSSNERSKGDSDDEVLKFAGEKSKNDRNLFWHDEMHRHDGEEEKLNGFSAKRKGKQKNVTSLSSGSPSSGKSPPENGDHPCWKYKDLILDQGAVHDSLKFHSRLENELVQEARDEDGKSMCCWALGTEKREEVRINCEITNDVIAADALGNDCTSPSKLWCNNHENMDEDQGYDHNYDPEYIIRTPVRLPGVAWVDADQAAETPTVCLFPEEKPQRKRRSREKKQKPFKKHHKRRGREESEEDDAHGRKRWRKQKLRRHHRNHRTHHKSRGERNRRKKRSVDASLSSSSEISSSSGNETLKDGDNVSKKHSGSRKRRHLSISSGSRSSTY